MSSPNPYEQLGVTESSSFEEIQNARSRLFAEHGDDRKLLEQIEAAYDAVLMDRLRLRQEGKIKVPDRIRFPEKVVQPAPSPNPSPERLTPDWLQSLVDTPSWIDVFLPAGILALLSAVVVFYQAPDLAASSQMLQTIWILAVGTTFYFLFRKERRFGRSVLLSFAGLIIGLVVG